MFNAPTNNENTIYSSPRKLNYGNRMVPVKDIRRYEILSTIQSPSKHSNSPLKKKLSTDNVVQVSNNTPEKDSFSNKAKLSTEDKLYSAILKNELLGSNIHSINEIGDDNKIMSPRKPVSRRLFDYTLDSPTKSQVELNQRISVSKISYHSQKLLQSPKKRERNIPLQPYKILDAPELQDDFYLNLIDWSAKDLLAVGLGSSIYLWDSLSSQVTCLADLSNLEDTVTSICWNSNGDLLAVGTKKGNIHIWDITKFKMIKFCHLHSERIGVLSWYQTSITTGSRDRAICIKDIRSNSSVADIRLVHHTQEVCGIKWSPNLTQLASGGNDNQLCVWNASHLQSPAFIFHQHTAAVKAIGWSFHQDGLLASGGGTVDRTIRFWNTLTGSLLHSIDSGSQVCSLLWSKNSSELVSVHGYSQNHVAVWKYPQMEQVATLLGHTSRVLYLTGSPCGQNIATGAGDETLRFWKVFEKQGNHERPESSLLPHLERF